MMRLLSILLIVAALGNWAYVAWDERKFESRIEEMIDLSWQIIPFVGPDESVLAAIDRDWLNWLGRKGGPSCSRFAAGMIACTEGRFETVFTVDSDQIREEIVGSRYWWSVPPLVLAVALLIPGRVKRKSRRDQRLCKACGYNLTGNESGRCSECGQEVMYVGTRPGGLGPRGHEGIRPL